MQSEEYQQRIWEEAEEWVENGGRPRFYGQRQVIAEMILEADRKGGFERVLGAVPLETRRAFKQVWSGKHATTIADSGVRLHYVSTQQWPFTPGQIARTYVRHMIKTSGIKLRKRPFYYRTYDVADDIQSPKFFLPCRGRQPHVGHFINVDLTSAYAQLLFTLPGPQVAFSHGLEIFNAKEDVPWIWKDFILNEREIARCLLGIFAQKELGYYSYGTRKLLRNPKYNPSLKSYVLNYLHELCSVAITDFNCFRWHTDGGIFELSDGLRFISLLDRMGLHAKVKNRGLGILYGLNIWYVPDTIFSKKGGTNRFFKARAAGRLNPDTNGFSNVTTTKRFLVNKPKPLPMQPKGILDGTSHRIYAEKVAG